MRNVPSQLVMYFLIQTSYLMANYIEALRQHPLPTCQVARSGYPYGNYEVIIPGLKAMSPQEKHKTRPLLLIELSS